MSMYMIFPIGPEKFLDKFKNPRKSAPIYLCYSKLSTFVRQQIV